MRLPLFSFLAGFCSLLQAQIPKSVYPNIFRSYFLQNEQIFGVFDSTDSYFVTHFDSVVQSPFDPSAFLSGGKIWHKGQTTSFKGYISIDTVIEIKTDTNTEQTTDTFWALKTPEMKIAGTSIWNCSGEIRIIENDSAKYAGTFNGTFGMYFYYRSKNQYVKPLSAELGFGNDPGMNILGFWRSPNHQNFGHIPFCMSNCLPQTRDDNTTALPDLRFQSDGSSSFSNIAIFPEGVAKPPVNWFQ
ncbi:MAG: hypothetical protein IT244_02165 [Bacteroidia bacterium]|nr:hypothetical protein [Bacteroidia bacterium]